MGKQVCLRTAALPQPWVCGGQAEGAGGTFLRRGWDQSLMSHFVQSGGTEGFLVRTW